jgi:uncharacterized protein YoxC
VSPGGIAAIVAAAAFVLLVGALVVPILKLARTVDATTRAITRITDQAVPILADVRVTVEGVNRTVGGVNGQLDKIDTVTDHISTLTGNVSSLSSLFAAALGRPVVKAAAIAYGVRSAVGARRKAAVERDARAELRSRRRAGRSA